MVGVAATRMADRDGAIAEIDDGGANLMLRYAQRSDRTVYLVRVGTVA
jgi:hypothetical protein